MSGSVQLAAIMFTDIAGYTAIMGRDTEKAMELVRKSKEIQKPMVEKYRGKWIKEMGDGVLAQFNSAIDAVNCAIEIQRASRADLDADLRIGIHLGDITINEHDVFGDGVNVASRLESVADPGGIYVSESIEKAIHGLSDIQSRYLGEISLKNVDYGVRTYALQGVGLPVPDVGNKDLKGQFWAEIQRRGVLRAGISYILTSILLVLIVRRTQLVESLPSWGDLALFVLLGGGLLAALFLAWTYEKGPSGFVRTSSDKSWKNPLETTKRKPLTSNLIQMGLIALIAVAYFFPKINGKPVMTDDSEVAASYYNKSIAVLPFKNLSGNEENVYFSDGVMEAILNNLSRIRDLKVISRTSVEKYRNQNMSIKDIARDLEVANILEGSVQRVGDEVRITAQLIAAENDEHIWADNYDRRLTDIFELQSEIAQTIADNLEVIVTTEERELIKNAPTANLKAYEQYLKADYITTNSKSDILKAIRLCDESIKLDPEFGWPYVLKARLLANLSTYGYEKSIWYDSAMVLVEQGIEKDNNYFFGYSTKAQLYDLVHLFKPAADLFRKTIELNPNYGFAYWMLGQYYMMNQQPEAAVEYMLKGTSVHRMENFDSNLANGYFLRQMDMELACKNFQISYQNDPTNFQVLEELIGCSRYYRDLESALKYAEESLKLRPELVNAKNMVAESHLFIGDFEQAEHYYREMIGSVNEFKDQYAIYPFIHRLGYAMMKNGKKQEGKDLMEKYRDQLLQSVADQQSTSYGMGEFYDLGIIYAALGEKEEAYQWLNMASEKEKTDGAFFRTEFLLTDPLLDNLREDTRFMQILNDKMQQQEEMKKIFHRKLSEYHTNNELMWLNAN